MKTFTLTIRTENAAFGETEEETRAELARIINAIARRVERGSNGGPAYDLNGNAVGSFDIGE